MEAPASLREDAALARDLAVAAGALLLARRRGWRGGGPSLLGAAGDREANAFLVDALRQARPEDGLLSEEALCDGRRLRQSRVWIVDPVDGTREFGEGRDDWAVHVGLSVDGRAAAGAVSLPALDLVFDSAGAGALPPLPPVPRIVASRSRLSDRVRAIAGALGADLLQAGSAGFKAMMVVRGLAEAYVHEGGQSEWDNCAPAAVALAHGLHVSRLDGAPLAYNRADVLVPDLVICRTEIAAELLAAAR